MIQNKKILITTVIILTILAAGVFVLNQNDESSNDQPNDGINYDSPTSTELDETSRYKDELANDENNDSDQQDQDKPTDRESVVPFVSFWGQESAQADFEINAYVPEIVEKSGVCTLTLTRNDNKVSTSKTALPDAQSTSCGLMNISADKLTAGEWQMVVHYESNKYEGTSEMVTVNIK